MASQYRTLFSKSDLFHFADRVVSMHIRFKLILDMARLHNDKVMEDAYSGIVTELEILIDAYKLRELIKID